MQEPYLDMDELNALRLAMLIWCLAFCVFVGVRPPPARVRYSLQAVLVLGACWVGGDLLRANAWNSTTASLALTIVYTGILWLPPTLVQLALRFASQLERPFPAWCGLLPKIGFGLAALLWIALVTNPLHWKFAIPQLGAREIHGPIWEIQALVGNLSSGLAIVLYTVLWRQLPDAVARRQVVCVMTAAVLPMIGALVYVLAPTAPALNPSIPGIALGSWMFVVGIQRSQLLSLLPSVMSEVITHHSDGLVLVDPLGRLIHANPAAHHFVENRKMKAGVFFYPLIANDLWIHADPPTRIDASEFARWVSLASTGQLAPRRYRLGPGTDHIVEIETTTIPKPRGGVLCHCLRLRDITAPVLVETAIRLSEARYRALVETSNDLIWSLDADGQITFVNAAAQRYFGRSPEELIGRAIGEYINEFDWQRVRKEASAVLRQGRVASLELTLPHRDGSTVDLGVSLLPVLSRSGAYEGVMGTAWNTLDRSRMEARLQRSEERYQNMVRESHVGVLIVIGAKIVFSNPAVGRITGYDAHELRALPAIDLIHEDDRDRLLSLERERRRELVSPQIYEAKLAFKDGTPRWVEIAAHRAEFDGADAAMIQIVDITKREKAEQERVALELQIRQAQKLEAVGTLSGGIAHDFNNMLTGILGNLELARTQLPAESSVHLDLNEAERSAHRAAALTRQLLSFSRKETSVIGPVDLRDVVGSTARMLRTALPETIELRVRLREELPVVQGDAAQLEQTIVNLGINARDAMPEGGRLDIEAHTVTLDAEAAARRPEHRTGAFICVTVRDDGEGIDPDSLERIFDPFFTTKEPDKGTGLGLAMVYSCAEAHDGWVSVDSNLGQGTTFRLYIPKTIAHQAVSLGTTAQPTTRRSETLLMVDDAQSVLDVGRRLLEKAGHRVFTACNGIEAVERYRQHRDEIDAVITDLVMPQMGGRDLLRALRKDGANLPVIATSGYAFGVEPEELIVEGFAAVIPKPFHLADLTKAIQEIFEKPPEPIKKPTAQPLDRREAAAVLAIAPSSPT